MIGKRIAICLAALVVVASAFGLGWWLSNRQDRPNVAEPEVIKGSIAALSDSCLSGGTCSITVGTKVIVTGCAVLPSTPSCDNYDHTKLRIGGEIEATAIKADTGDYYNLDCDICTIKAGN